ncbi:MAG: GNAT family N-acetyltransferase [Bacteroidota bacterium]
MSTIRHIARAQMDVQAWDQAIEQAPFSLPYAFSWVLDLLCAEWDGLVKGDYEAVMPLPFNRKLLGFKQIYQPFYLQQLGIFSRTPLSHSDLVPFLEAIPNDFRKIQYPFNEGNAIPHLPTRHNMVLDLQRPYEEIYQGYNRSAKRNLRKWKAAHRFALNELTVAAVFELYTKQLGAKLSIPQSSLEAWQAVMEQAIAKEKGIVASVHHQSELGAAGFFWTHGGRIINPFGASTDAGRGYQSMRVLLDALIEQNAEQAIAFDFEGSSIPSIAEFFQSFGPEKKPYPLLQKSAFPYSWLDRWRASK